MRRSKYVLGLIFILIASFIITSCSESDKEEMIINCRMQLFLF